MDIEISNINIMIYAILILIVILFIGNIPVKFKKGIMVANTKYAKNTKFYKKLRLKYWGYKILVFFILLSLVLTSSLLITDIKIINYSKEKVKSKKNILLYIEDDYERESACGGGYITKEDICYNIDEKRINKLKKIVDDLENDEIGIVYRNNYHREDVDQLSYLNYNNLPVMLSSFSQNKTYTQYVLDSLVKTNSVDLREKFNLPILYLINEDVWDRMDNDLQKIITERIKIFDYITAHFYRWNNIFTTSGFYNGLPSGNGEYTIKYHGYWYFAGDFESKNKNEKFMSRLSYLDFINSRFEKNGNNISKIVIWYSDDPKVQINEELEKNKEYCKENGITILPLDSYNEGQIVNEINKINNTYEKEIMVVNNDSIVNNAIYIIVLMSFSLFVLEWRIK